MNWDSETTLLRANLITQVKGHLRSLVRDQRGDGRPNYSWLSRQGGDSCLSKEQVRHLEQLTYKLDGEGCLNAMRRLDATLGGSSCSPPDVVALAECVILQETSERQREHLFREEWERKSVSFTNASSWQRRDSISTETPLVPKPILKPVAAEISHKQSID